MKTIAVIGANGRSGRVFVDRALRSGYIVRAGVHNDAQLPSHENLMIVSTDATNIDDVRRLLEGCDIVVSLIGHVKNSPARVQTDAMRIVTSVMQERGIRRIVSLTGTGARMPGDSPSLLDRLLNALLKVVDPDRINDGVEHFEVLKSSDLDWTIVRVLKLTSGQAGRFTLTPGGPGKFLVPRSEVAEAILEVLESDDYTKTAPVISKP